jgi:hypothetical protein
MAALVERDRLKQVRLAPLALRKLDLALIGCRPGALGSVVDRLRVERPPPRSRLKTRSEPLAEPRKSKRSRSTPKSGTVRVPAFDFGATGQPSASAAAAWASLACPETGWPPSAQVSETDFGAEKVRSNPGTGRDRERSSSRAARHRPDCGRSAGVSGY